MSFTCIGYLGDFCPFYQPDPTQYGAGTQYPNGFSIFAIMNLMWNVTTINIAGAFVGSFQSGTFPDDLCDCNYDIGCTQDITRSPTPSTMSDVLCMGGGTYNDFIPLTGSGTSGSGTLSVAIDMTNMLTNIPLVTQADWNSATYYPFISLSVAGSQFCFTPCGANIILNSFGGSIGNQPVNHGSEITLTGSPDMGQLYCPSPVCVGDDAGNIIMTASGTISPT